MNRILDLHLHTRYSDGVKTPEELIGELKANQVSCFSLTDHDNMAPFEAIKRAALQSNMYTLPGIEISSVYRGMEVHVLGYRFDWKNPPLKAFIDERILLRKERALLMFEMLEKKGYSFERYDIERITETHYVGRPHIAKLLLDYGYISDPGAAFSEEFIGDSNSEVITYKLKPVDQAIAVIKNAGGLAFLAHPGLFNMEKGNPAGMNRYEIDQLTEYGIDGLEVFHPHHTKAQIQRYLAWTKEKGLLISMGSDYHRGAYIPNNFSLNESKYIKDVLSWIE